MWAKANILAGVLVVAAAVSGGCGVAPLSRMPPGTGGMTPRERPAVRMTIDQADVEFNRAVALIGGLRYKEAISALAVQEGVAVSTHRIARAAECAFWHGYCREKLGDRRQAAIIYRGLLDVYPRTPAAAQAARRLAALQPRTPKTAGN